MDTLSVLLIAIGLSMDALAVAIGRGAAIPPEARVQGVLAMGITFGLFQALMPIGGWFLGSSFATLVGAIDHWFAFLLLALIGGRMVYEAATRSGDEERAPLTLWTLLLLAVATSIDALAVGVGLRFADPAMPILTAAALIGVVTFSFSLGGGLLGSRLGERFGRSMEALGGLVLIGIGLRILLEDLAG